MKSNISQSNLRKTSIIILTFNKLEYTQLCIESIRKYTTSGSYEIVVVDNNSNDGTRPWLGEQTDIITIFNDENLGFPKGCNQGIEVANGDDILLLNNDVIVTEGWLDNLQLCLYNSEDIGAVGPVTNNCSYYQSIDVDYKDIASMQVFAKNYNKPDSTKWEQRLKLIGFCMLIKGEVVRKIGILDEIFTPGNFEDDDYSYRMMNAGYKLILCKDTFVHHFRHVTFNDDRSYYDELMQTNAQKFVEKWGFNSKYSSYIRTDVLSLIDLHDPNENIRVLEVGCACGGTLLEVKNRYKNSEIYGIELNPNSAAIAALFAQVSASNIEKDMEFEEGFFDYIILPDVLEHLNDPWMVIENLKKYLKNNGKVISSIPNVMHHSVIKSLLNGRWEYEDAGLLDRTHVRFFTGFEIQKMFEDAGYVDIDFKANIYALSQEEEELIEKLSKLGNPELKAQMRIYQYLVKAKKRMPNNFLNELLTSAKEDQAIEKLIQLIDSRNIDKKDLFDAIENISSNKQELYNDLAVSFYNKGKHELIIELLQKSLFIDSKHRDTLYNLGSILYLANENELALHYLRNIDEKDEETKNLILEIEAI
ncbi:methyltransferase domain-containing protein [Paenibacillus sp. PsM32]|uniref:methyltransferase domain-containing protein n=1 Tax=Paenibacillus sp. PsM32 TaxID=3030536 RepID=UPI00263A9936|nr:methyltransferase domain-containing protein [Paenibacillus sp. PsM32]MDN4620954.1 methyltransferase domain-containing protein [Paenibacillus sp. PsM32]